MRHSADIVIKKINTMQMCNNACMAGATLLLFINYKMHDIVGRA